MPGFWANDLTIKSGNVALPENYLAVDLGRLSGDSHCNVDGLIGADFFRGRIVQIDFVAQKIRVLSRVTAVPSGNIFPLKIAASGALLVPARINEGRTEWLRLDTGCAASLQWVTRRPGAQEKSQQFAVGLSTSVILQTHTTVHLGNLRFESVATGLHAKAIFPGEAGLLGNGLLARFGSIIVDCQAGRCIIDN